MVGEISIDTLDGMQKRVFPKYATQIINLANQNAQATRPKIVGQLSELINKPSEKSFKAWQDWYLKNHPKAIDKAVAKIMAMLENMRYTMDLIDEYMVKNWVYDLVINKTAQGLIIQEAIFKDIAMKKGVEYKMATKEDGSKGIDGYIGGKPYSLKPLSYIDTPNTTNENFALKINMIHYDATNEYITYEIE